jgi:hypothetical protein
MDLIGHLAVIDRAGVLSADALWGSQAVTAMFPNLAHCHDWAYDALWEAHRGVPIVEDDTSTQTIARLIQGHMICDWVIHYGPEWTPAKRRIGWAYQIMPIAVGRMDQFMDHLVAAGLVDQDPRSLDTRDHLIRDFGHTAVECALDFLTAERYVDRARLGSLCRALAAFGEPGAAEAVIGGVFDRLGAYTTQPRSVLQRTAEEYGRWSRHVHDPREFAAYTLISKYDMAETPAALSFVCGFLATLASEMDAAEVEQVADAIAARIADPELALGGRRPPARVS